MNRCAELRERLLTADLEDLRSDGNGPLVEHLRSCPACARAAEAVREATAGLDALLDADTGTSPDVSVLVARARGRDLPGSKPRLPPAPSERRRWIAGAALLAAATTAALLLLPGPPTPDRSDGRSGSATPDPRSPPVVEAAASHDVVVLSTSDSDITVLWFF